MNELINVKSEIGRLQRVMLHRPGVELSNLMPDYLERMLAEDTPDVRRAGEEHDVFANILRSNDVDVVYIEDMFAQVVKDDDIRKAFIDDFVDIGVKGISLSAAVKEYLNTVPYDKLFDAVAKGITVADLKDVQKKPIQSLIKDDYPFLTDPLPNLYFTRDISFCLGTGIAISAMSMPARMRETLFVRYIHKYSEYFGKGGVDLLYDYNCGCGIEGGDVLSLSDKCVAIGSGERTTVAAVERLALTLFERGYERVLLFKNPSSRTYMHLDVLMTHIDYDKFLAHPCIAHKWFDIYEITPSGNGELNVSLTTDSTEHVLERALGLDKVTFVEMGGGDPIQYRREHWNMGANSLAMAPGSIITYDRNVITNELIDKAGVKVNPIPGGELSRGRGGPRCMSMPMLRERISFGK
ncbi:MAG: arginine deiminase [Christensenellaceae bacterium]|nr:arginine deiminase [Christensenellaceae bacterium]